MKFPEDINTETIRTHEKNVNFKSAEDFLLQSRQDWEDTFNTITDMITIHDRDFNIIKANKAAEKILNLPLLKDMKTKCYKYYHGSEDAPEGCPSCNCLKTGRPANFEIFEPHLNMFIEIRAMPRLDRDNRLIGLIHVVRDITERKKMEEDHNRLLADVTKAKLEWEMTFDNATEIIVLVDRDLNILRCNRSFAEFTQVPLKKLIGRKIGDFLNSDSGGVEYRDSEGRTEIRSENDRWIYLSYCPVLGARGEFLHSILIGTDITKTKNIQQKLIESESELKNRVNELEKFYEIAINRELKIQQLKKEIKKLNDELLKYKAG